MGAQPLLKHRGFWFILVMLLGGLSAWGWFQRGELLAWHWTRQLAHASPDECSRYVDRLVGLEEDAVPALLARLHDGDETAQTNCGWALAELARRWGIDTQASALLATELQASFEGLNPVGQRESLTVLHALLNSAGAENAPEWLKSAVAEVLPAACRSVDDATRPSLLALAAQFMHQVQPPNAEWMAALPGLVDAGLQDTRAECRSSAIRLAAAPHVARLDRVVQLLSGSAREPVAEVRVVALLALGGQEELLSTDELLPYLHDPDAEVRNVCEQALRSRGLMPAHVQLARQMTDPRPTVRARVPALVHDFPDLDTQLWLERLSRDNSPAVRAAVLRAAGDGKEWRLADRMREMASGDPSPTVRQIARHYLQQQLRDE